MIRLTPSRLRRYKELAGLLIKHGRTDLLQAVRRDRSLSAEETREVSPEEGPREFARDLEALGPTFVKIGQFLSTRSDLLPEPYLEALSRLQDDVAPFDPERAAAIVEEELGSPPCELFDEFRKEPVGSASFGQVHRARLEDGREVAVKIQRPDIREQVTEDLDILEEFATSIDRHTDIGRLLGFRRIVREIRTAVLQELDYLQEAQNLLTVREVLSGYARIVVPRPEMDLCTSKVLTMDYVDGRRIREGDGVDRGAAGGVSLAEDLYKAYLDQVLLEGFFQADPHPGNVLITGDGRLALLDFGMARRIDPVVRGDLLKLLVTIADRRGREAARICLRMGSPQPDADPERFVREGGDAVLRYGDLPPDRFRIGDIVMELVRSAVANGIRPVPEIALLGKTLLSLDRVGKALDPGLDPVSVVRKHAEFLLLRHTMRWFSRGRALSSILEVQELFQKLPGRLNHALDLLAKNRVELKMNVLDEPRLMSNLQKIANRITLGLVLAALIVGAALMMRVRTEFTIFGYPGIAILLFLLAAGFGIALAASIVLQDYWNRKR